MIATARAKLRCCIGEFRTPFDLMDHTMIWCVSFYFTISIAAQKFGITSDLNFKSLVFGLQTLKI